ncbi:MAG: hypothetical protein V4491_02540 [Pseudomonadota bacterium]
MTDIPNDPNPALRAELLAAIDVLDPQIGGLRDLAEASISEDLRADIRNQILTRERRRGLIEAVLGVLDQVIVEREALAADGYPVLPPMELPESEYEELQAELAEILAAIAIFQQPAPAVTVSVDLGSPADKEPPAMQTRRRT